MTSRGSKPKKGRHTSSYERALVHLDQATSNIPDEDARLELRDAKKLLNQEDGSHQSLAKCTLGELYINPLWHSRESSAERAFDLFYEANLAGSVEAKIHLGRFSRCGLTVEKNVEKAVVLFKSAHEGGVSEGMVELAYTDMFLRGRLPIERAFEVFKNAIELDALSAYAPLGRLYTYPGSTRNYTKAAAVFEPGAARGCGECMNSLGMMHQFGRGSKKDQKRAKAYYTAACKRGCHDAFYNLSALLCDHAKASKQEMAERCLEVSIARSSMFALHALGVKAQQEKSFEDAWEYYSSANLSCRKRYGADFGPSLRCQSAILQSKSHVPDGMSSSDAPKLEAKSKRCYNDYLFELHFVDDGYKAPSSRDGKKSGSSIEGSAGGGGTTGSLDDMVMTPDIRVLFELLSSNDEKLFSQKVAAVVRSSKGSLQCPDDEGLTLLHHACVNGQLKALQVLLKNGVMPRGKELFATLSIKTGVHGLEALQMLLKALKRNNEKNLQYILNKIHDGQGPALHIAISKRVGGRKLDERLRRVEALLEYKADVNVTTSEGKTPLHLCAETNNLKAAALIVAASSNVPSMLQQKDKSDRTPRDAAEFKSYKKFMAYIDSLESRKSSKDRGRRNTGKGKMSKLSSLKSRKGSSDTKRKSSDRRTQQIIVDMEAEWEQQAAEMAAQSGYGTLVRKKKPLGKTSSLDSPASAAGSPKASRKTKKSLEWKPSPREPLLAVMEEWYSTHSNRA